MAFKPYILNKKLRKASTGVRVTFRLMEKTGITTCFLSIGKDVLKFFGNNRPKSLQIFINEENARQVLLKEDKKSDDLGTGSSILLSKFKNSESGRLIFIWEGYLPKPENRNQVECKWEHKNGILVTFPE